MYLTRFTFNPARRGAQRLLGSPHALHAAVLAGFPDPTATETGRVLWRLDSSRNQKLLYVVSPQQPDLTHLAEQAGWPTLEQAWESRPYEVLDRIADGQKYQFRLTANPTRTERNVEGGRGKTYGHVTVSQQEGWLRDRSERSGFRLRDDDLIVSDRRTLSFSRRETSVTLRIASYEGVLEVTDREAFVHTLSFGLGRAKGYGCGLMTLAAAR
ncbi:CRISPR system Cascade subunit CasE [Microbacterium resistens]|uniref:CRISPR system Cascade subunit CasE n=1 Tax=Microbacterium resistens TaxID=156977 RepID=A0ABU1SBY7_9MICO|nr:type I-E CRISPR-associated protein Cas6/Cse3/CasE [Microbacterium resistens]MDR6867117.1 CRISPR system Cascade subunit CasE [Microbacterium resistens]